MKRDSVFIFNIEPVPKARPRVSRRGTYTPTKTRNFEHAIAVMTQAQVECPYAKSDALLIEIDFYFERKKSVTRKYHTVKPDVDNLIKSLLDGMQQGGAFHSDSQIIEVRAKKHYGVKPSILVRLGEPIDL